MSEQALVSLDEIADNPALIDTVGEQSPTGKSDDGPYKKVPIGSIADPPDCSLTLPHGYVDMSGDVHRDAVVRELTGADEEYIAKQSATGNLGKIISAYLERGVESIGGQPVNSEMLKMLVIGDRDALLLKIRQVTFGDTITFDPYICPECGEESTVEYDLSVVPIRESDPEEALNFKVELRDGRVALCTLPTGADQEVIFSITNKTPAERAAIQNTVLLGRCVNSIDGAPFTPEHAAALGLADRRRLLKVLDEKQPGPDYNDVRIQCSDCGKESPMFVSIGDLFRGE